MPPFLSFPKANQNEKITGLFIYKNEKGENVYVKLCDCKDVNIEMYKKMDMLSDSIDYMFSCRPLTIELTLHSNDSQIEKEITDDELKYMMEGLM